MQLPRSVSLSQSLSPGLPRSLSVPLSWPSTSGCVLRPSRGLPRAWFPTEPKRGGSVFGVHTRHPPAAANTAPHPRNFPSPTGRRRKTATTLSLHPEARKQPPLAPRQRYQRAGGPILRATRDVSPPARAGSPGGINRMSARPGRVDENLVCAPGEGAVSLPRSPPGLGPRPRALPAASTLRSPGNPPPAHLRRPGPAVQRRARGRRGALGAHGPTAAAAPPAGAKVPRCSLRPRRPQASPPPLGDTHHFRVRPGRGAPGRRAGPIGGLAGSEASPAGPRRARARGRTKGRRGGDRGWGAGPALSAAAGYSAAAAACARRRDRLPPLPAAASPPLPAAGSAPLVTSRVAAPERGAGTAEAAVPPTRPTQRSSLPATPASGFAHAPASTSAGVTASFTNTDLGDERSAAQKERWSGFSLSLAPAKCGVPSASLCAVVH